MRVRVGVRATATATATATAKATATATAKATARVRARAKAGVRECLLAPLGPASTWVATVRGTYPTPEAGTRNQYVLYVGP